MLSAFKVLARVAGDPREDKWAWVDALGKAKEAWDDQNSESPHVLAAPAANTKRCVLPAAAEHTLHMNLILLHLPPAPLVTT